VEVTKPPQISPDQPCSSRGRYSVSHDNPVGGKFEIDLPSSAAHEDRVSLGRPLINLGALTTPVGNGDDPTDLVDGS
jgi:hypothetical protein